MLQTAPPPTAPPPTTPPPPPPCSGIPYTDWACCSSANPCDIGGGDCDRDADCTGGLTCGNNNCKADFSSTGSNWSPQADCCDGKQFFIVHLVFYCCYLFDKETKLTIQTI